MLTQEEVMLKMNHACGDAIMDIGALITICSTVLVVVFLRHLAPTHCWIFGGAFLLAFMAPGIIALVFATKSDKKDWDKFADEQIKQFANKEKGGL